MPLSNSKIMVIKVPSNSTEIKIRIINRCMSMKISFTAFRYRLITFNDVLNLLSWRDDRKLESH